MPLRCRCREDAHKAEMGFDACTSSLNVYAPTLLRARAVSTPVATFLSANTAAACTSTKRAAAPACRIRTKASTVDVEPPVACTPRNLPITSIAPSARCFIRLSRYPAKGRLAPAATKLV